METLILKEISKEEAIELFPNYGIYFEDEKGTIDLRCWWDEADGRFHKFPEAKKYYLNENSYHKMTQKSLCKEFNIINLS